MVKRGIALLSALIMLCVCGCTGGFIGRGHGSPQCFQLRFCHSCFLL